MVEGKKRIMCLTVDGGVMAEDAARIALEIQEGREKMGAVQLRMAFYGSRDPVLLTSNERNTCLEKPVNATNAWVVLTGKGR